MAIIGAVGDAPLTRGASRRGLSLWATKKQTGSGANPIAVVTGLKSITAVSATLDQSASPADAASVLTVTTSGGTVNIYRWQNTGGTDPTLAASTTDVLVDLVVVGVA